MMGKQNKQIQMIILDIDSIIPENHLLRRIKNCINFDFYQKGLGYLVKMTIDTKHGIFTGADRYSANKRENDMILKHLKKSIL